MMASAAIARLRGMSSWASSAAQDDEDEGRAEDPRSRGEGLEGGREVEAAPPDQEPLERQGKG